MQKILEALRDRLYPSQKARLANCISNIRSRLKAYGLWLLCCLLGVHKRKVLLIHRHATLLWSFWKADIQNSSHRNPVVSYQPEDLYWDHSLVFANVHQSTDGFHQWLKTRASASPQTDNALDHTASNLYCQGISSPQTLAACALCDKPTRI